MPNNESFEFLPSTAKFRRVASDPPAHMFTPDDGGVWKGPAGPPTGNCPRKLNVHSISVTKSHLVIMGLIRLNCMGEDLVLIFLLFSHSCSPAKSGENRSTTPDLPDGIRDASSPGGSPFAGHSRGSHAVFHVWSLIRDHFHGRGQCPRLVHRLVSCSSTGKVFVSSRAARTSIRY